MLFAISAQAQGVSEAKETKPNLVKAALKAGRCVWAAV